MLKRLDIQIDQPIKINLNQHSPPPFPKLAKNGLKVYKVPNFITCKICRGLTSLHIRAKPLETRVGVISLNFCIDWGLSAEFYYKVLLFYRWGNLCLIIGGVHQFIGLCISPLDRWKIWLIYKIIFFLIFKEILSSSN